MFDPAKCIRFDELTYTQPLRVEPVHECFHDQQFRKPVGSILQLHYLAAIQTKRLFAQYMLTRLKRPDTPGYVQVVWQRDINGINPVTGKQFFIAAKSQRRRCILRQRVCKGVGSIKIP